MTASFSAHRKALDDIKRIQRSGNAKAMAAAVARVTAEPEIGKLLQGNLSGFRTLAFGARSQWRIVYIEDGDRVFVIAVGSREGSRVYRDAVRRVESLPNGANNTRLINILLRVAMSWDDE